MIADVCGLRHRWPARGAYYRRRFRCQRFGYSGIAKGIQMKTMLATGAFLLALSISGCTLSPTPAAQGPPGPQGQAGATGQTGQSGQQGDPGQSGQQGDAGRAGEE